MSIVQNSINANSSTPLLPLSGGLGLSNPTAHGVLVAEGASAAVSLVLSAGQLLIGTTAGDPAAAALTAGSGISIVSASGAVTISSTVTPSSSYVSISGTTQTAVSNTRYGATNAALTTVTLPAAPAQGDVVSVRAVGAGGFSAVAGSGTQVIHFGNQASSAGGSISSSQQWDAVNLECETAGASAVWQVVGSVGGLTVA